MKEKQEYRSAIRSRKLIRTAFMELVKEKPFDKITVTDIVKRADVNRSTFYAHYPDVFGLVEEIQDEILSYAENALDGVSFKHFLENPKPVLVELVKMTEESTELYRLLSNSNIAVNQLAKMKNALVNRTMKTIEVPALEKHTFEMEVTVRFFMCGIVDIYVQWLNEEIDCTVDELIESLTDMLIRASKYYLID